MSSQKFVAIGDIHGCRASLDALFNKLVDYKDRTFIFIGDYIDRGPDSKGVVDLLLELQKSLDIIFLRGNHEQMLLDAIDHDKRMLWLSNGGKETLKSYGASALEMNFPEAHMRFYRDTRMFYNANDYFFVHAGLRPDKTITESTQNEQDTQEMLWERSHLNALETKWEKPVVFGHTPRPHPIQKEKMIGIDTGCVYDKLGYGKLTAALLPEEEFIQQHCID